MPKKILLPLLCIALALLVSCDNNSPETPAMTELDVPVFDGFKLCKTVAADESSLLLCYYQNIAPDSEDMAKILCYDTVDSTYTEVFSGQLICNSFYDAAFDRFDGVINIYAKSSNSFYLKYDIAARSAEKVALDHTGDFAAPISDTAYLVGGNEQITVNDTAGGRPQTYDTNMWFVDYALRSDGRLAALDNYGGIILLDCAAGSLARHTLAEIPEGIVDYAGIKYASDNDLIITVLCEDSDVYQIFDIAAAKVAAQHEAPRCELADTAADTILFVENDDSGRKNSRLVAWNYKNNTAETLFDVQEHFAGAYILSACFSDDGAALFMVIQADDGAKLLRYDLANA